MMTPREWLAQEPLQDGEQVFVILASTSECQPVAAWRQADGGPLSPVWAGSEYGAWGEVMPYVALVSESSGFLDWVARCTASDWGWLGVSSSPLQVVVDHLASLTKVRLPEGQEVFFRFWDGGYLLPILQALGPGAGEVIPVFRRYWINGQLQHVPGMVVGAAKKSPWWNVPATLLKQLGEQSSVTLVDNLLQWLAQEHPDLHDAFAPATLKHKVAYFVRQPYAGDQALVAYLAGERG